MDERTHRVGENEIIYREVNERVLELNDRFGTVEGPIDFVCECGNGGCVERIELMREEYERVRASGRRFVVAPGHQAPGLEDVVEETERFVVVEKRAGEPAAIAESADPR